MAPRLAQQGVATNLQFVKKKKKKKRKKKEKQHLRSKVSFACISFYCFQILNHIQKAFSYTEVKEEFSHFPPILTQFHVLYKDS